jgi:hypothetical protein
MACLGRHPRKYPLGGRQTDRDVRAVLGRGRRARCCRCGRPRCPDLPGALGAAPVGRTPSIPIGEPMPTEPTTLQVIACARSGRGRPPAAPRDCGRFRPRAVVASSGVVLRRRPANRSSTGLDGLRGRVRSYSLPCRPSCAPLSIGRSLAQLSGCIRSQRLPWPRSRPRWSSLLNHSSAVRMRCGCISSRSA